MGASIVEASSKARAVEAVGLANGWCLDEVVGCLDIADVELLNDVLSSNEPADITVSDPAGGEER